MPNGTDSLFIRQLLEASSLQNLWKNREPRIIAQSLVEVLFSSLKFEPVYVSLHNGSPRKRVEAVASGKVPEADWRAEVKAALQTSAKPNTPDRSDLFIRSGNGSRKIAVIPIDDGRLGVIAASSPRAEFPDDRDRILLLLAAHQAGLALASSRANLKPGSKRILPEPAADDPAALRAKTRDERFRLMVDAMKDCSIVMLDPRGQVIDWNAGAERVYGYREGEIHLRSFSCFYAPSDDKNKPGVDLDRAKAGERIEEECWRRRRDGTLFLARVSLSALRDEAKRLIGFAQVTQDISERRMVEQALSQSEQGFRRIFEDAPVGMALIGSNLFFHKVNIALARMLGHSRVQMKKLSLLDVTYPEDIELDSEEAQRLYRGEIDRFTVEKRLLTRSRKILWARIAASLIHDENGRILYKLAIFEDVTVRKRAEEKIAFQATLLDHVCNSVIATDLEGRVTFWNSHAENLYQWKARQVMGKPIFDLVVSPSKVREAREVMERVLKDGCWEGEFTVRRKDGSTFQAYIVNGLIRKETGEPYGFVGVSFDITERKRSEEHLRTSQEQMRALTAHMHWVREKERTHISREIHDELGQALTGLKIDLSWLDHRLKEPEGRVLRSRMLEKISAMSDLVDTTIKHVRRITTELRPRILDELGLVPAIEWQAREFQRRTGIRCRLMSMVDEINLDDDRATAVFRIFQETLTNVSRHARASKVDIALRNEDGGLALEVRDNGRGMSRKQVSDSHSLGLLGMRERALLARGRLTIDGARGKGTRVTVWVPVDIRKGTVADQRRGPGKES